MGKQLVADISLCRGFTQTPLATVPVTDVDGKSPVLNVGIGGSLYYGKELVGFVGVDERELPEWLERPDGPGNYWVMGPSFGEMWMLNMPEGKAATLFSGWEGYKGETTVEKLVEEGFGPFQKVHLTTPAKQCLLRPLYLCLDRLID